VRYLRTPSQTAGRRRPRFGRNRIFCRVRTQSRVLHGLSVRDRRSRFGQGKPRGGRWPLRRLAQGCGRARGSAGCWIGYSHGASPRGREWGRTMTGSLIFAVPSKGRLMEQTAEALARVGLNLRKTGNDRGYRGEIEGIDGVEVALDRKSTRLNSSHVKIS